jgi:hypothetical protein
MRNLRMTTIRLVAALGLAVPLMAPSMPVLAQTQAQPPAASQQQPQDNTQHHPGAQQGAPQTAPSQPGAPAQGAMPGQGSGMGSGMGMMGQGASPGGQAGMMMNPGHMMQMMQAMQAMPMMRGMMGMSAESGRMGMMGRMPFEHVEGRLAFLRAELKITKEQQPQWNAFANASRASGKTMRAAHEKMTGMAAPTSWPERLDRSEQALAARLSAVKALKTSTRALYEVLSDEQKKLADELMRGPMGMM